MESTSTRSKSGTRTLSARREKEKAKVVTTAADNTLQENAHRHKKERAKEKEWSATHAEATIWQGTATQDGSKAKEKGRNSSKGNAGSVESKGAKGQTAWQAGAKGKAKRRACLPEASSMQ